MTLPFAIVSLTSRAEVKPLLKTSFAESSDLFESEFYFASPVRKLIFYIAISIFALSFCVHVLPSFLKLVGLLKSKSDIELAKLVRAKHPEVRDKLVDALQIYEQKSKSKNLYSEELIDSAFAQLASEV